MSSTTFIASGAVLGGLIAATVALVVVKRRRAAQRRAQSQTVAEQADGSVPVHFDTLDAGVVYESHTGQDEDFTNVTILSV